MNKRIVCALLSVLALCSLAGCGKKEPTYVQKETITVSINTAAKAPTEYSQEEFEKLTAAEVKEMVETYLPNYRNVYQIEEDRVMTDDDWLNLKDLMYYQLYGVFLYSEEAVALSDVDFSKPGEIMGYDGTYLDPNWIYYAPCPEFINQLSDYDFGRYMNGLMAYGNQDMGSNDFTTLEHDDLEILREKVLTELCKPWGSFEIPTVAELDALANGGYNTAPSLEEEEATEPTEVDETSEEDSTSEEN